MGQKILLYKSALVIKCRKIMALQAILRLKLPTSAKVLTIRSGFETRKNIFRFKRLDTTN